MGVLSVGQNAWLLVALLFGIYHFAEGGAQEGVAKEQITPVLLQTGGWTESMGHAIAMRGVSRPKDCCFDYPTVCPAQPCVMSEWSHWSGCVQPCQASVRVRRRSIEKEPQNSGQICPKQEELAGCIEYQEHQGHVCAQTEGPAFITTMEYSKGRTHDLYGAPVDAGFCMEFKLESLTPQCVMENRPYTRWMQYLKEGYTVCVACQPPAISNHSWSCQGDGNQAERDELLHWQAVGSPHCRGTWRKVQRLEHCSCPQVHSFIFI